MSDIVADEGVILEALNGKADIDLNNVNLDKIAAFLSADYDRAVNIPVGKYTPPP